MSVHMYSFEYAYEMACTFAKCQEQNQAFFDILMFYYEYDFANCLTVDSEYWKYHGVDFLIADEEDTSGAEAMDD
jgi:hypothetical protein